MDINQLREMLRQGEVVKPSKAIWDKIPEAEKAEARAEVMAEARVEAKAAAAPDPMLTKPSKPKVIEAKRLAYRDDKSDKVYIVKLVQETLVRCEEYTVEAEWGRRGYTMQSQIKTKTSSRSKAYNAYVDLINSKKRKGYQEE